MDRAAGALPAVSAASGRQAEGNLHALVAAHFDGFAVAGESFRAHFDGVARLSGRNAHSELSLQVRGGLLASFGFVRLDASKFRLVDEMVQFFILYWRGRTARSAATILASPHEVRDG